MANVKSGWKSMFMVFTTAAGDKEPMIVSLAFDTIEKIVREHFRWGGGGEEGARVRCMCVGGGHVCACVCVWGGVGGGT